MNGISDLLHAVNLHGTFGILQSTITDQASHIFHLKKKIIIKKRAIFSIFSLKSLEALLE